MRLSLFSFLAGATLLLAPPSFAQMGKMKWVFSSRADVTSSLQKTRGNLRNTYDVLICSARQGYSVTSLKYYDTVVAKHEFDADVQDSAAFAFAHDLSSGFRPWYWKKDPTVSTYRGSGASTALLFRDRALRYGAGSPEVMVMRSYWLHYQGFKPERRLAYDFALKAAKLAPGWADAHYWLSEACSTYAASFLNDVWPTLKVPSSKVMMVRLGKLGMRSLDKAEKINPTLRPYLYLGRIQLSQIVADKQAARMIPVYAEAQLSAFPYYQDWYRKHWQPNTDVRAMYAKMAADIGRKATS